MRVINVGLIGYGLAGSTFHAPLIRSVEGLRLASVVTSRRADVMRDCPAALAVASAQDVFTNSDIDLVVIATPNATHFDLAQRALRAAKHVVIDKPMTTTSADADALIALARESGKQLSVYQNRRWDGDFLTVKSLIGTGRLGHVYSYEAHYDRFRPSIKAGWRELPGAGSGLLFDLGAHLIDQALVLFGQPQTVTADVIAQRPRAGVDDYFHVVLGYADRRAILHAATLVCEPGPHFAVHGDAGSFLKYGMDRQEVALKAGQAPRAREWGSDDPALYGTLVTADGTRTTIETLRGSYRDFYRELAAALSTDEPLPVAALEARNVIALIELAARSSVEGRTLATQPVP